jgi:hypothetical protein
MSDVFTDEAEGAGVGGEEEGTVEEGALATGGPDTAKGLSRRGISQKPAPSSNIPKTPSPQNNPDREARNSFWGGVCSRRASGISSNIFLVQALLDRTLIALLDDSKA